MRENSRTGHQLADALIAVWRQLYADPEKGLPGDAGTRAVLRRAASPLAVLMEPVFHNMLQRMNISGAQIGPETPQRTLEALALSAALLAERRDPASGTEGLMHVLGAPPQEEDRRLNSLRFQALMAAMERGSGEEKLRALRRAMKMAAGADIDLKALVRDLLGWGERTRLSWTFDYFHTRRAEPAAAEPPSPPEAQENPQ